MDFLLNLSDNNILGFHCQAHKKRLRRKDLVRKDLVVVHIVKMDYRCNQEDIYKLVYGMSLHK